MPLQAQQIVTRACAVARTPGWISQAGQYLNSVLQELCETYDFDPAIGNTSFNFNLSVTSATYPDFIAGMGPYNLPSDYLRADPDGVYFYQQGVKYDLVSLDFAEFAALVATAGLSNYPTVYATDMSQSPPALFVWMPPSGAFPVVVRYRRQMPDITTPETSSTVPWFPFDNYLITRIAGELMKEADDERCQAYLGDGPGGAEFMLRKYLALKDDTSTRAKTVKLDRRRFGKSSAALPNTKQVGW
jgi:hypothetical protein